MNEIQKLIQDLRGRGWSVAALSRELGVDQATISRWRSGATQPVYIVPVTRVLRQLLDQPVPKRTYTRRR